MKRATCVVIAAALLGGCSSYKVVKLNADGSIPASASGGVPVTLGRPQFVVKKVEGSDPEQYQVSVTYVPDPDQRYAVRIASTPLANAELSLAFTDAGGLSSSTATVKDQVVPTTLALFKVAASTISALGPLGFLSKTAVAKLPDCFEARDVPSQGQRLRCVLTFLAANTASACYKVADVKDGLIDRLDPFIDEDSKDKGDPTKAIFAINAKETDCLAAAKKAVDDMVTSDFDPKGLSQKLSNALAAAYPIKGTDAQHPISGTDAQRNGVMLAAIGKPLTKAIESGNAGAIKRFFYVASDPERTPAKLAALFAQPIPDPFTPDIADGPKIVAALDKATLSPLADPLTGLDSVQRVADASTSSKALSDALTLQPGAWRSRYIAWLQKRADIAEKDALAANLSVDVRLDPAVRTYREQIAALAGVRAEFDRWMSYQAKLATIPRDPLAGQRLSPAGEYESVRAQSAALEQGIAAAIAARLTGEAPKKPDPLPPASPWVASQCIASSKDEAWRYRAGASPPQFVVVLRRADGKPIDPPKGASTCAIN